MEYFASLGTAVIPNMAIHKAILHVLGKRYAIFTKAKELKDFGWENCYVFPRVVVVLVKDSYGLTCTGVLVHQNSVSW